MIDNLMTILIAVIGSSGAWATLQLFVTKRLETKKKDTEEDVYMQKMLLGLGHDRIYTLCTEYIVRGSITLEEYDNLQYLAVPYIGLKGNGTGKKLLEKVDKLPIINN